MAKRSTIFVNITELRRLFGIQNNHIKHRDVQAHELDGKTVYSMDEVVAKCSDLIVKTLSPNDSTGKALSLSQLKTEETREKVRKLRIENDVKESHLVDVEEMMIAYGRKVKAVCDILDQIPMRIKTRAPSIPQAVLSVVVQSINEARNKAANHNLESNVENVQS